MTAHADSVHFDVAADMTVQNSAAQTSPSRPLRIGIMLRHFQQHGGVAVYAQQLVRALLALDTPHTFVLFYRNWQMRGTFGDLPHVEEVALPSRSILYWDQVKIPRALKKYRIDVLFNPKYSIPLRTHCPTAWVCHGLDWYVMPEASPWLDRISHRFLVPRYAAKADALIAVSKLTRDHVIEYLGVPPERIHMIYPGIAPEFRKQFSAAELEDIRRQLGLPQRYVLYSGAIYPPKNFTRLVRAYAQVGPALGVSLVIAGGENRYLSAGETDEPERLQLHKWVHRLGWLDHTLLPAVYAMAAALLLPSLFESVGLPILEAMATGCPVLTSNRHGTQETAGSAAALVNPESEDDIAAALRMLLQDEDYRNRLVQAGRQRADLFQWEASALSVLKVLENIAAPHTR